MSDVVHVACKLPSGLSIGGQQLVGTARDRGQSIQPPELVGGYAITLNVPADVWNEWLQANRGAAYVRNHLVFAEPLLAVLKTKARSLGMTRSGLEPAGRGI